MLERLGDIQTFRIGSEVVTAEQAVTAALARHAGKASPAYWALYDLWDRADNGYAFASQTTGDVSYTNPRAGEFWRKYLKQAQDADAAIPGGTPTAGVFTAVAINRGNCCTGDEFSRNC